MPTSLLRSGIPAKGRFSRPVKFGNLFTVATLLAVLLLGAAGPAQAAGSGVGRNIKVMTRNIDSGTDYGPLFVAATPTDFMNAVTFVYQEVLNSQPAQRAAGIAQEIANAEPDLVSLQEVETWYTGPFGATAPVTNVTVDQLSALMDALANLGMHYQAIAVANEFDFQGPSSLGITVRISDHDVVLVRTDGSFTYANAQTGRYQAAMLVPTALGITVPVPRGWASVDVNSRQGTFRFIGTHLEAFASSVQLAQAQELAAGPVANAKMPVIVAGDFNSAAAGGPDSGATYAWLTSGGGLADAWSTANPGVAGYTYPLYLEDPDRPATPTERIDLILTFGGLSALSAYQVGTQAPYAADHIGVVATVK